jgi:hypothetical protein
MQSTLKKERGTAVKGNALCKSAQKHILAANVLNIFTAVIYAMAFMFCMQ